VVCAQFLASSHSVWNSQILFFQEHCTNVGYTEALATFGCSIMLGKFGYYQPFLWAGGILITIGSGLYYTLDPSSWAGSWIGYQIVAGVGQGIVIQLPAMVAQKVSSRQDLSVTVGIVMCEYWGLLQACRES
jgi:hypothetical protein